MSDNATAVVLATIAALASIINVFVTHSVKQHLNSRMDEFIELVRKEARAEGFKEGRAEHQP